MSHIYRQGQQCGDLQREWGGGQRGSAGGGEGGSMGTGRDLALGSECAVHFADNVLLSHEPETCGTLLSNVALIHSSKKKI